MLYKQQTQQYANHSGGKSWQPSKGTPVLFLIVILFGLSGWAASPGYTSSRSASYPSAALGQTTPQTANVWTSHGPEGAAINSLTIDPSNPKTIYAGTYGGSLFKSTDGGASWTKTSLLTAFYSLAIDPTNSNILYVVNFESRESTVFKSTDGGASWTKADKGLPDGVFYPPATIYEFSKVVIDPHNSTTLYLGALASANGGVYMNGAIYMSNDGGTSWKIVNGSNYYTAIYLLAIDPVNANTLYGLLYNDPFGDGFPPVLSKSTDGGASWSKLNLDVPNNFAVSPSNPNILYASLSYSRLGFAVSKSTDGGANWQFLNSGLPDAYILELVIDPANPDIVYAGTQRGLVFKSVDGGASWNPLNNGLPDLTIHVLAIDPSGTFFHAGTPSGVFDYQVSAGCEYALSPASQTFEISGGTGSVDVTTEGECSWKATSFAGWISIISGDTSSSGNGVVSFTVEANNQSIHPRTGTLLIGTRSFTVTQAAPPVVITFALVKDKNLYVDVENFNPGGVILINGVEQKTTTDEEHPTTTLVTRKAGKKIASGESVKLQVRNPNGDLSPEFTFTRP